MPQILPDISKDKPITNIGNKQDLEPIASPFVTTKAEPSVAISAKLLTDLYFVEV